MWERSGRVPERAVVWVRSVLGLAAVLSLLLPATGSAKSKRSAAAVKAPDPQGFTIQVSEHEGASGAGWPFTAGVPLPMGWIADINDLEVRNDKRSLPMQARALSRWPDGSLRWVLLDWQSELHPHGAHVFEVRRGVSTAPPTPMKVEDLPDRVDIDTGAIELSIPKNKAALIVDVRRRGRALLNGPITNFFVIDGKRLTPQAPTRVRVIDSGPLRARVEMRGQIGNGFVYVVRIDAYANQPFVRILHTFENHASAPYTAVQQVSVDVPLELSAKATYSVGRDAAAPLSDVMPEAPLDLYQEDNEVFYQGAARDSGHLAGWFDLHDTTRGVALVARYFWQEYPQSVRLRRSGLTYNLWAPQAKIPAKVGMGAAKTHEMLLYFHAETAPTPSLLEGLRAPTIGHAEAQWIVRSGALRNGIAPSEATKTFLSELGAGYDRYRQHADRESWDDLGQVRCPKDGAPNPNERRRQGFYGMLNWGDWNYPGYHDDTKGCDAWGNLEYDLTQTLALAYAATGEARYLDAMTASARHFGDVDHIYFQRQRPNWVGMNHPKNPLHFSFELGGVDLGHTWNEGLLSYYAMTGDERAFDAARGIADYLVEREHRPLLKGNPRQFGWPQIALVAMYEMTGDEHYRAAARGYAQRGMKVHKPERGKDWKLGVLAEALAYTHSVTNDRAIADWLTRYSESVSAYPGENDPRFLPALAYVGRATGKTRIRDVATSAVPNLKFGTWGKPWTIAGRVGFAILSEAAKGK
ncbi:MAG: glycoside hydrolase family 127 protein [Deltaproteobacteria bacterium]|nr:glycoside hydrolase family 127 protein [Deltaproteobacteria bacterium]